MSILEKSLVWGSFFFFSKPSFFLPLFAPAYYFVGYTDYFSDASKEICI